MPIMDESAYCIAATLALDLIEARPKCDDGFAAEIAWEIWKHAEAPGPDAKFQGPHYLDEVLRAMRDIRDGRLSRVEHSPPALVKALEQLDRTLEK